MPKKVLIKDQVLKIRTLLETVYKVFRSFLSIPVQKYSYSASKTQMTQKLWINSAIETEKLRKSEPDGGSTISRNSL